jgi:NAD(P)-dependent dehydrogenase (short-subunit alcohol dehydrogenase family)
MRDPVKTPFGFSTTASEVVAGVRLDGKIAVVTGGAAGLGLETARALAAAGASVTLAVRRPFEAEATAAELRESTHNAAIRVASLDLSDLTSVRRFVVEWEGPLHILVNNAGIMAVPTLERTLDGHELQFATNFLGHFALTSGLYEGLRNANGARVVCVSSSGHMLSPVIWDDIDFNFVPYDPLVAYGQSKSACTLLAVAISGQWGEDGILANALNPGAIATGLQKHTGGLKTPPDRRKTREQGAATSVLLAASPLLDGVGGQYFEDCNVAPTVTRRPHDFSGGVAPYAIDAANAARLWDIATAMVSY